MEEHVVGVGPRGPEAIRARELVHELITAHIFTTKPDGKWPEFSEACTRIVGELNGDVALFSAFLLESTTYTHTCLSAIASGMDPSAEADDETVALFHRAMIDAWTRTDEG
jgi:hypothetical protein